MTPYDFRDASSCMCVNEGCRECRVQAAAAMKMPCKPDNVQQISRMPVKVCTQRAGGCEYHENYFNIEHASEIRACMSQHMHMCLNLE